MLLYGVVKGNGSKIATIEEEFPNKLLSYHYIKEGITDMRLYFVLSYSPFSELKRVEEWGIKNMLTSYWTLRGKAQMRRHMDAALVKKDKKFFLDSGAFTAFTKKVVIDLDEYCDFIKQSEDIWTVYAGLDVIGDYEATRTNIEYMESKGLKPLPTFHFNSPIGELDRMLEKYDYIALGGLVPLASQKKKLQGWLDYCFQHIYRHGKDPLKKVHGFGINALWAWKRYPFYSVDATSWNRGMKFGQVYQVKSLEVTEHSKENPRDYLMWHKDKDWVHRTIANINTYLKLEAQITELWRSRGIFWNEPSDR